MPYDLTRALNRARPEEDGAGEKKKMKIIHMESQKRTIVHFRQRMDNTLPVGMTG